MKRISSIIILAILPFFAYAVTYTGLVIKIADGDTLTILTQNHQQIRVRLNEIDAPERRQAFGTQSRQSLAQLCFQQIVVVESQKIDFYGRVLGRVYCNKVDANAEQIKRGMAWVYNRYVTDKSLYYLQDQARLNKVGLWRDNNPTPPWLFRHSKKLKSSQAVQF